MKRLPALLAVATALAGCGGGGGDADEILSQTASKLGEIRSGTLHVDLRLDPRGPAGAEAFGFRLEGPFSLGRPGSLPIAEVEYTQSVGERSATVKLISTGNRAFVETGGRTYELPPEQADQLRSAAGELGEGGGLGEFRIDEWIQDPEVDDGGDVGGAETDRVQAELDVVAAARDLLGLLRQLGQDAPQLTEQDVERLADSVRSTRFELYTGKEDRLLRRLELEAEFGLDVPPALRSALGSLVGATFVFELGIDDPNRPVTVEVPKNVLPASELPQS